MTNAPAPSKDYFRFKVITHRDATKQEEADPTVITGVRTLADMTREALRRMEQAKPGSTEIS